MNINAREKPARIEMRATPPTKAPTIISWSITAVYAGIFPILTVNTAFLLIIKPIRKKFEDADSTFISPKFVQLISTKPLSEWILSVGRHEGFISSRQWIDAQNMLDDIVKKYNRPHRKTNALLAELVYCPHFGKRLRFYLGIQPLDQR